MTSPMSEARDVGRRFSGLLSEALQSPATVDKSDLLRTASAFLDAAQGGDVHLLPLARSMAASAMDFAVFSPPEDHANLTALARAFQMTIVLKAAIGEDGELKAET
jgi:hypothetical protein